MTETLDALRAKFDETFEQWGVTLPEDDVAERRSGYLKQQGGSGSVRYVFGSDDRGEYLEYYAFHRIWGDHHARIYESGEVEALEVLQTGYPIDPDDPEVAARNEREMIERNRKLLEELETAGLMSGGPVPMSFTINATLVSNPELEKGGKEES